MLQTSVSEGNYPLVIVQLKSLYPISRGNRDGSNDIICLASRLNLAGIYIYVRVINLGTLIDRDAPSVTRRDGNTPVGGIYAL